MIVGIHQPNFLPWLGFFNKIYQSDAFVLIDEVQFTKGSYCNRLKFKSKQGDAKWLSIPVNYTSGQSFVEVFPQDYSAFVKRSKRVLEDSYSKAINYKEVSSELFDLLSRPSSSVGEINIGLIKWVCEKLEIDTRLYYQSELGQGFGKNNDLNLGITLYLKGDAYLSGNGAKAYNNPDTFKEKGIQLMYQSFTVKEYTQLHGDFVPGLSVLDALFNLPIEEVRRLVRCG